MVDLGISNETYVEVTKGLNEHDVIAMDPVALMSDEAKRNAFGSSGKATKRDWAKRTSAEEATDAAAVAAAAGADAKAAAGAAKGGGAAGKGGGLAARSGGPAGKGGGQFAKGAGAAKGKRAGGGGFMNNPIFQKMQKNLTPEEMASMRGASPEDREALMKKAGLTDEEIETMAQMRRNMGGGRGGPGGGGGFGGGGFGGGRRRRWWWRGRIGPVSEDLGQVKPATKPIVRLVDVTKIYVMGHSSGGGGLLSRRTPT